LDDALPEIFFDSEQIYQVLFNIVFNAIQAMPDGGELLVRTSPAGPEQVVVELSDTGMGIAPEKLEQIFTPFYTEKNRGTGLGLTIAKSIVDKHAGRIEVSSTPGAGSTFRIFLPIQAEQPDQP
jgi:signal transduction histidine kinase